MEFHLFHYIFVSLYILVSVLDFSYEISQVGCIYWCAFIVGLSLDFHLFVPYLEDLYTVVILFQVLPSLDFHGPPTGLFQYIQRREERG